MRNPCKPGTQAYRQADMAAYDQLPADVRQAIAASPLYWDCFELRFVRNAYGITSEHMIHEIKRRDREFLCQPRQLRA